METREQNPKEIAAKAVAETQRLNREISTMRHSMRESDSDMVAARRELGLAASEVLSPGSDATAQRLKNLEKQRDVSLEEQGRILEIHGRSVFPSGEPIYMAAGRNEIIAPENDYAEDESSYREVREQLLKERAEFVEELSTSALKSFERGIREVPYWYTEPVNVDLAVMMMKERAPKVIAEKLRDYVEGKVDKLPFSTFSVAVEDNFLFSLREDSVFRQMNEPLQVSKVDILFDGEPVTLVDNEEIVQEEPEENAE